MLNFVLLLATIGQTIKPGDEATIYNASGDRFSIPAFDSDAKLEEFVKLTECRDDKGIEKLLGSSHVRQIYPETKVRYIGGNEVIPDSGPSRGMRLFVLPKNLKRIDPQEEAARLKAEADRRAREVEAERREAERARRAWEAARAARGPIDPVLVAKDLRDAISAAKAAGFRKRNVAVPKGDLIRPAIEGIRLRYVLETDELLKIANEAKVYIHLDGGTFDITGRRLSERLGEGR